MASKKKNTNRASSRTKTRKASGNATSTKSSSGSRKQSDRRKKQAPSRFKLLRPFLTFFAGILVLGFILWVALLDFEVRKKFDGKRWAIPAKVYARPLELYAGLKIMPADLLAELNQLHYREKNFSKVLSKGEYALELVKPRELKLSIQSRGFHFSNGEQESQTLRLHIRDKQVIASSHALARLEPQLIGGIYPSHNEDRVLIQLEQTPPYLIESLLMVEDREFFEHYGVSPKGIARAALVNVFSGEVRQGGSTLTQQLVKNFYLNNERTLIRKINEALMAVLLETHYSKNEILEAYLNEVNLGQIGKRGIHGFGLASQHYFGLDIEQLELHQVALLVAMVKGPSFYEPRRNPERAAERRNLVLDVMVEHGFISIEEGESYKERDLGLTDKSSLKHKQYPAFLQLVKQQLKENYSSEDLQSEGLRIFTSLDPILQSKAERSVTETIGRLRNEQVPDLQGAFFAISPESSEVLALVAGADLHSAGFNRVLDARRSVGSLLKPAVYLTALRSRQLHWASMVDDSEIYVDERGRIEEASVDELDGSLWSPKNFDKQVHGENGQVPMLEAMSQSYNQATVRLGLQIGLDAFVRTLKDLGLQGPINVYPSTLLGTLERSPFEVTQMYQTIASGGFNSPIKAIREVQDSQGEAISRYPMNVKQVVDTRMAYLLHAGLQEVVKTGTASSINRYLPESLGLAGKTGTSGEQRDSWFVGYGSNILATTWVGNDNNTPTPYTGASAALKMWTHFAINFSFEANNKHLPEGVEWVWIDPESQKRADENCQGALFVPVLEALIPGEYAECARTSRGLKSLFGF